MNEWSDERDYREGWYSSARRSPPSQLSEFCFREAGVTRFNDVVDDGYEESEHQA